MAKIPATWSNCKFTVYDPLFVSKALTFQRLVLLEYEAIAVQLKSGIDIENFAGGKGF